MYGLMGRGSGCGECMGPHVDGVMFGIGAVNCLWWWVHVRGRVAY